MKEKAQSSEERVVVRMDNKSEITGNAAPTTGVSEGPEGIACEHGYWLLDPAGIPCGCRPVACVACRQQMFYDNHPQHEPESTLKKSGSLSESYIHDRCIGVRSSPATDQHNSVDGEKAESVNEEKGTVAAEVVIPKDKLARQSLQELGIEIRAINAANGWAVTRPEEFADRYKFPAVLALIHSEVSEALEAFRESDETHFCEEMADVLIRVLDCVVAVDPDFDATVAARLEVNRGRGYHHGGKKRI